MHKSLNPCPFHGCTDAAIIKKDGYAFIASLTCGAKGSPYSILNCGEVAAIEFAVNDWNARAIIPRPCTKPSPPPDEGGIQRRF